MIRTTFLVLVALTSSGVYGQTTTGTLADCKTFARLFRNTCTQAPDGPATTSSFATSTVSCTQEGCPTGGGTAPNCSWRRKLCVSCTLESNKVYIRVQSNGLPDHCYGGRPTVNETNFDFKVLYNSATSSVTPLTLSSQSDFDNYMCMPAKLSNRYMPTSVEFTDNLSTDPRG
jgi:hypothetical protein